MASTKLFIRASSFNITRRIVLLFAISRSGPPHQYMYHPSYLGNPALAVLTLSTAGRLIDQKIIGWKTLPVCTFASSFSRLHRTSHHLGQNFTHTHLPFPWLPTIVKPEVLSPILDSRTSGTLCRVRISAPQCIVFSVPWSLPQISCTLRPCFLGIKHSKLVICVLALRMLIASEVLPSFFLVLAWSFQGAFSIVLLGPVLLCHLWFCGYLCTL
jgi:hypothetical protein